MIGSKTLKILSLQRREITQHHICMQLLGVTTHAENRAVLQRIANDELRHYDYWRSQTAQDVAPDKLQVFFFSLLARVFGVTFALKLLERMEGDVEAEYAKLSQHYAGAAEIQADEAAHEQALIALLNEERLDYIGSVMLGLNDALVELTGALAGFTLALQNTRLIAVVGLITGLAASLSMAASQYIAVRSQVESKGNRSTQHPLTAAIYTGLAYVVTVVVLITPYFLFTNMYLCLALSLGAALLILLIASFYLAVVQDTPFLRRFIEMALISLGVALLTFSIGYGVRLWLGVEA